ncbi:hypothetical protein Leryth_024367 [Lithospermum erythrorhizon]|nr:hypothetical protein Leryth_024367 [Lithospermum erythrorhizon]
MAPQTEDGGGPLLPEVHHQEGAVYDDRRSGGGSISGAIFNVSTGMVGAGIMSIPATFKVLGIVPSFVVILVIAFFVEVTSFGKFGSVGLQLCVLITNLGALIIYLIIIGSQTGGSVHLGILQEWFGDHWWTSREYSLLIVVLFGLLPLVLLHSLRHASAVSILLAVLFVVMCSGMAIYAMLKGRTETPKLVPDFSHGVSLIDLFTTIPVFATAFGCHVNVHPIRAELDKPSEMSAAVRISLIVCVAIYFAVGFFGYLLFGDSIMADMLVNFDESSGSLIGTILNPHHWGPSY